MPLFRPGLLDGCAIALAGDVPGAVRAVLDSLGAALPSLAQAEAAEEEELRARASALAPLDALVCASAGVSTTTTDAVGQIERQWLLIRATALGAFLPRGGGRIVLLAPAQGGGARTAAAAHENLARTLSVEWARHAITVTAIVPNASTSDDQLAALVAFLCSPAGAYYSGCRLELGSIDERRSS